MVTMKKLRITYGQKERINFMRLLLLFRVRNAELLRVLKTF